MKRLRNHLIGIDQGDSVLFSDFEDGGSMWTGTGPRAVRKAIKFSESFREIPTVKVSLSMWDMDAGSNPRADLRAEEINREGFVVVFRTWGDTRIARVRADWIAIGELRHADDWDLY